MDRELKRREKQRAIDARKAEKAANAPQPVKKEKEENKQDEEELNPNVGLLYVFFSRFYTDLY
jgi:hypothetical protein